MVMNDPEFNKGTAGDTLLAMTTIGSHAEADTLAQALVAARVAACVSIVPGLTFVYHWQGGVEQETECMLLIKTSRGAWQRLSEVLHAAHPYELPELLAVPVEAGSPAYLSWLKDNIQA